MKKYAVYFLQEVHCSKDKEHIWSTEWGIPPYVEASLAPALEYVCFLIIISTFKF